MHKQKCKLTGTSELGFTFKKLLICLWL